MATATVVKKTSVMANADIGPIDVLNSCQEVLEAASYKRGGRRITKTISGSSARFGNCGTNPIINPAITNKMGYGNFLLLASAVRMISIAMIKIISLKFSILFKLPDSRNFKDSNR